MTRAKIAEPGRSSNRGADCHHPPPPKADPRRRLLPDDELRHGNVLAGRRAPASRASTTFSAGAGPWAGPARRRSNTCCSGIVTHGNVFTVESSLLVVARLWSVCAEAGLENITTTCVTSFAIHNEILELLHEGAGAGREGGHGPLRRLRSAARHSRATSCTAATSSTATAAELAQLMKYRLVDTDDGSALQGRGPRRLPLQQDLPRQVGRRDRVLRRPGGDDPRVGRRRGRLPGTHGTAAVWAFANA